MWILTLSERWVEIKRFIESLEWFIELKIKIAQRDFDSDTSESKLELDKIDSRFKKMFIFFKIILNTMIFLIWVAWSKLQTFNSRMSSCIKDWWDWSAYDAMKILKDEEL